MWNIKKHKDSTPLEKGMFKGVFVGDLELENYEKEVMSTKKKNEILEGAIVYGGIKVNKKEEEILNLPPDHTTFPKVVVEEFNTDMEKCVIKCNWQHMKEQRQFEEKKALEEASEEIKSNDEETYNKVYDNEKKSLDMRNIKPTDFKNNKRVVLPELNDDSVEIKRNNLKNELRQIVINYKEENCDKFGNILENNLSKTQLKEIKNFKSRMDKEGLACGETDKRGKMTLDTLENMSKKMDKHIKDDKVLNEKEVKKLENKLNRHMTFWVSILKPGENSNQVRWVKSNLITKDSQIPI